MAGKKSTEALTELQQQFKDIIEPILEEITIDDQPLDTLSSVRLQDILLERDIDEILILKNQYQENLNVEEKADLVHEFLQDILDTDSKLSKIDSLIKQLIENSVVVTLKSEKRRELTLDFQKSFIGLVVKEEVKTTKDKIEKTKEYKEVKDVCKTADSNRRKVRKNQRNKDKIVKTEKALEQLSEVISNPKTELGSPDLKKLIAQAATFLDNADKIQQRELNANASKQQEEAQSQSTST